MQIQKNTTARPAFQKDTLFVVLFVVYLLVPLGATLIFALSSGNGLDLGSYQQVFSDKDFLQTLLLSLELSLAATILAVVLVTPTVYWMRLRLPQARPLLDFLSLVPFAFPAILLAVGLNEVYGGSNSIVAVLSLGLVPLLSSQPFNIVGTPSLLICAYVIVSLPATYRPIDSSLRTINTRVLTEAAYSLGGGWWRTFLTIVLPNILPGVVSAALLTFSTAMGEFTLSSLFGIYTFPIYLSQVGQSDARKAAALSILSFLFTLVCVLILLLFLRSRSASRQQQVQIVTVK
ncbi:spermidine/putrescine ABC transporter permease [Dictyobacter alpinus]|uniref:Spermidine/putrescine ABC transporter permease n=1 Tax=Dictyobacter alpinus TaxID=2014873 RepID=A0A402BEB7_9CHLR|nr:ABC transporter permease subunit [Dictyobacter alpinus]GCE29724.1 spermidine/putrescine ABC transporter permease [Dictyobacter alpinus]